MLFITPQTDAKLAKDYFTQHMDRADYYLKDAPEIAGQWHGLGAELLGLSGDVDKARYFQLCDNINPETGGSLTPHTKANRRILYDFTFDAPKSVSLAYELEGDERILDDAFRPAINDTMAEMEGAMMARVRSNQRHQDRATGNMIWAEFIHRTTRPVKGEDGQLTPDPQLHCHAVVFNASFDTEENKWKAGQFSNLVRDKGYYQAAFHARLAANLSALGYSIERDGNSFRLAGIDPATAEKFSRRTDIIEAEAQRLGITDAKAKGELGRRTREGKDPDGLSLSQLRGAWRKRITDAEAGAITSARNGQAKQEISPAAAMDYAIAHRFERESAIPEKELLKTALIRGVGSVTPDDMKQEISRPNILRRAKDGITYATTREVLAEEIAIRDFVREGRGRHVKLGGIKPSALDPALGREHCKAGEVILNSRDTVTALKGGAGTGKTTLLKALKKVIKSTGKELFAFAPSAEASRGVQRAEGFDNAETVECLLTDPKMQEAVKGQVIWVDEAGLLSVKDMKRLFDVAKQQNARLLLTGDTAQHNAVGRGDALRLLEQDTGMKTATLKEIRRQTNENYRAAVKAISEGNQPEKDGGTRLETGIRMLDDMGAIREAPAANRYQEIAADYAEITASRKHGGGYKTALVVSPTHREGEKVSAAIREELKTEGRLGTTERQFLSLRPLNLTEAERGNRQVYRGGEIVQFVQNAKGYRRGERATVTGKDNAGVHIKRADGSSDLLPLNEGKKFQVYAEDKVALAAGDRLRVTMNGLLERETRRGLLGRKGKDRIDNGAVYEVL